MHDPISEPQGASASVRSIADPKLEYEDRLKTRLEKVAKDSKQHRAIADGRLGLFLVGVAVAVASFGFGWFSGWWLVPVSLIFLGLVVRYDAVGRRLRASERRAAFYQVGLQRLNDEWRGKGDGGDRFAIADHPFDADLDLFGVGSLFERLCSAYTGAGKSTLAGWLLHPAVPSVIRGRQEAVKELRDRLDLREDIALLGEDVEQGVHPETLIEWGTSEESSPRNSFPRRELPIVTAALVILNFGTLLGWLLLGWIPGPVVVSLVLTALLFRSIRKGMDQTLAAIRERSDELRVLATLLDRIEQEPFESSGLREIRERLDSDGALPSQRISKLARLAALLEFQRNQLFAPIAILTLWNVWIAIAVAQWRRQSGTSIASWLAGVGQFEALCAIASYTFENPDDPFPEILEEAPNGEDVTGAIPPTFDATGLGHPLIPRSECVRNDLRIGGADGPRMLLVSGSNMSGKSTLLRSVGANAVLAMTGAPVRADSLRLSRVDLGATLRVQDSLQAGRSRFFAEITRLRQLVELASSPPPLLFLIDEVLHGTNSHDRRLGAEGVVRGLLERGAIGLMTTHDLALAEIVEGLGQGANVHFEDHFEEGQMRFDYRMRPGVVRKSNALELMRAVGLEV